VVRLVRIALVLAAAGLAACRPDASPLELVDLEGRSVDPFARGAAAADVFLFTRTDCPISNRYAPEVRRLYEEFAPRSVRFWLIYPDPDEPVDAIRAHIAAYGYPFEALRDPRHTLVTLTGARVTPEAAVFAGRERMVYRGRIDDRYVDFGQARAEPTSHDLRDALAATLEGRAMEPRTTRAVGCFIPALD
jgi:hypothetical protein